MKYECCDFAPPDLRRAAERIRIATLASLLGESASGPCELGQWTLPIGSLVIVDHLHPDHLRQLIDNAERTNTKLLLLTNDDNASTETLTTALNTYLP